MKNKKSDESRRKLLKSIAAGSGAIVAGKSLPENWTKPIVNSVVLPAHAVTSGQAPSSPPSSPPTTTVTFVSTAAPFGSNTSPGPDISNAARIDLPTLLTVSPAPSAPNDAFTIEGFFNNVSTGSGNLNLLPDGTFSQAGNTQPFIGQTGVFEIRIVWQSETISLFWNLVNP